MKAVEAAKQQQQQIVLYSLGVIILAASKGVGGNSIL